jgi:hypothetical protein
VCSVDGLVRLRRLHLVHLLTSAHAAHLPANLVRAAALVVHDDEALKVVLVGHFRRGEGIRGGGRSVVDLGAGEAAAGHAAAEKALRCVANQATRAGLCALPCGPGINARLLGHDRLLCGLLSVVLHLVRLVGYLT